MTQTGRNQPCPCGSEKKYKKCCLLKEEAALQELLRARREAAPRAAPSETRWQFVSDPLDDLSNDANDLIHAGRLDEAEVACRRLLDRYPDEVDGPERMAQLLEARGDKAAAADQMRRALALAQTQEGFEEEALEWMREQIARLQP